MKYFERYICLSLIVITMLIGCRVNVEPEGGRIDHSSLTDGVYEGISKGGPVKVKVKILVKNQKLEKIEIGKHSTLKGKKAEKTVIENIISAQSTDVDAVSRATVSSRVIMNAVQNALDQSINQK